MGTEGAERLRTLTSLETGLAMVGQQNVNPPQDLDAQIQVSWFNLPSMSDSIFFCSILYVKYIYIYIYILYIY